MKEKPGSTPEMDAVVELIFESGEEPLFIDGSAPLEDIVREPESFMEQASARFGFQVEKADLKLTLHEFAERVKREQRAT
jgi:hypothetical protein